MGKESHDDGYRQTSASQWDEAEKIHRLGAKIEVELVDDVEHRDGQEKEKPTAADIPPFAAGK